MELTKENPKAGPIKRAPMTRSLIPVWAVAFLALTAFTAGSLTWAPAQEPQDETAGNLVHTFLDGSNVKSAGARRDLLARGPAVLRALIKERGSQQADLPETPGDAGHGGFR
jgi:hypothetical protein